MLNSSMRLLGGETLACPNFMCNEIFMQKELKRFLEHTIHCRPFYSCANCNKKCASNSNLIAHEEVCIGTAVKLMQVSRIAEDPKIISLCRFKIAFTILTVIMVVYWLFRIFVYTISLWFPFHHPSSCKLVLHLLCFICHGFFDLTVHPWSHMPVMLFTGKRRW